MDRRLAAIVAMDVARFSRLIGHDEEGTLRILESCRQDLIEPLLERHGGRVANTAGDSFLIEFQSAVEAARFALAVQKGMAERAADTPADQRILYRLGINIGDVVARGEDLLGDGVNIAARLEALAPEGGIVISGQVYEQIRDKLDVKSFDLGEVTVKNIARPVRAYQLGGTPVRPRASGRRRPMVVGFAVVAAILVGAGYFWHSQKRADFTPTNADRMAFPLPDKPSIAVLPFTDLSGDAPQNYLADGLTEDLITDLSRISELFVIASASSFTFRDTKTQINVAAEALAVRYILRGSIRQADAKLHVNVQLIDATTGQYVWADRFSGTANDIFSMQERIALAVASSLGLKLTEREQIAIDSDDTDQPEARKAFQRGWELYSRFNPIDNARSVRHFKKALEIDPDYGRAYGALALVYMRGSIFQWEQPLGESRSKLYRDIAPRYLQKAEENGTALVHVVRAMRHLFYRHSARPEGTNRGTDDARAEAAAAIAVQPNDPEAHVMMAWALIAGGSPQQALKFIRAAERLNPQHPSHYHFFHAAAHLGLGQLADAGRILEGGLDQEPDATALLPMAASVFAHLGQRDAAAAALNRWRPGTSRDDLLRMVSHYEFPIRWIGDETWRNFYLLDGLRVAALPANVTVKSLIGDLADATPDQMIDIIRTIGWFGPGAADAVGPLVEALKIENRLVQKQAVIALGKIGPASVAAIEPLGSMIDRPIIGFHAEKALKRIQSE